MKTPSCLLWAVIGISSLTFTTLRSAEVAWTHELAFDALPNQQNSRWKPAGSGLSTLEESGLVLESTEGRDIYWTFEGGENDGDWDGARPSTIEFRVKARSIEDGMQGAGHLVVSDGANYYNFDVMDSEWHTYRIVLSGGTAMLYTDGDLASEKALPVTQFAPGTSENYLYFGDGAGAMGGVTEWEFVRWTNEGAFAP